MAIAANTPYFHWLDQESYGNVYVFDLEKREREKENVLQVNS